MINSEAYFYNFDTLIIFDLPTITITPVFFCDLCDPQAQAFVSPYILDNVHHDSQTWTGN